MSPVDSYKIINTAKIKELNDKKIKLFDKIFSRLCRFQKKFFLGKWG